MGIKLSVIMPVYNCEQYVAQAIQSIIDQTYTDWELLICDDGSTDNSIGIISKFHDKRIRFFQNEDNKGIVYTTNILLSEVRGEYIMLQDADDWSEPHRMASSLSVFDTSQLIGMVSSNVLLHFMDGTTKERFHPQYVNINSIIELKTNDLPFTCATLSFRKSILDLIGPYDTFFNRIGAADYDFIYRAFLHDFEMVQLQSTLYHVRRTQVSFTKRFFHDPLRYISPQIARYLFDYRLAHGKQLRLTDKPEFITEVKAKFNVDDGYSYFKYSEALYFAGDHRLAIQYAWQALSRKFSLRYLKHIAFLCKSFLLK